MITRTAQLFTAILLICGAGFPDARAQDDPKEKEKAKTKAKAEPPKERVTKIGPTRYRLGEIEFDAKTREIQLSTVMNMPEGGPIEYLLVHESGKVHEAMLVTKARPLHLQIVMKLLKFKAGDGQIFDAFAPDEEQRQPLKNPEKRPRGDALRIIAKWKDENEKAQELPAANLVLDGFDQTPMKDEPWIYTGSHVMKGQFLADIEGTLVAVYLDQLALLNMTREGANLDTRWGANEKATPPLGTPITILLRPEKKSSQ